MLLGAELVGLGELDVAALTLEDPPGTALPELARAELLPEPAGWDAGTV